MEKVWTWVLHEARFMLGYENFIHSLFSQKWLEDMNVVWNKHISMIECEPSEN